MSSIVIAGDTSGSVTLQAPAVAGSTTLTLPATSGTLALTSGITPAGSDTQVQYNNSSAFGAASSFTFNKSTTAPQLNITGTTGATLQLRATTATNGPYVGFSLANADAALFWTHDSVGNFPFRFVAAGNEFARFDSTGNFLVGTTTTTAKFNVSNGSEQQISQYINNTNSSPVGVQIRYGTDINATANRFIDCIGNATSRFIVYSNGNVVNTNNSYGAISDVKLKENIVDASPKLADLMQVKVRNYNLKADPTHKQLGVIAQELETIFPAMVEQSPDTENVTEIDEDGNNIVKNISTGTYTKSVKYSVFVPMLIKAMQEQQALITALTQRITALEGN